MGLTEEFAKLLRFHRKAAGMSQEELAAVGDLEPACISQLENGLESPTLNTVERLAKCLRVSPAQLLEEIAVKEELRLRVENDYVRRSAKPLSLRREAESIEFSAEVLISSIDTAHELIDQLYAVELDIAAILGMRNLSAFIGELYASAVVKNSNGLFKANPHQDGYPDLLLMDRSGRKEWNRVGHLKGHKKPFSPFSGGGIEVKATCGDVPEPAECRRRFNIEKPGHGDTRIAYLTGYVWKAHHRETNNLAGLLWDFVDRRPRIVGLFYSSQLEVADWRRIQPPKDGGGRTTSVSRIESTGVRKLYDGWLCVINDRRYIDFLNRKNRSQLIQPA